VKVPPDFAEGTVKVEARFDSGPLGGELVSSSDIEVRDQDH